MTCMIDSLFHGEAGKEEKKWKKSQNSPESNEQKHQTLNMFSSQQSSQQNNNGPQPNGFFQTFSQPNIGIYGQSYYSSSPLPPMGSPGQIQTPPQDVLSKILQRLDTMDKKLGQLDCIQSSVNKITDQVNTMSTKINGLETKMKTIEDSREFDSKSIDLLQAKQNQIDSIMLKMQKLETEQKEKLLDLQSREMRVHLMFYNFKKEKGETDQHCMEKTLCLNGK